jgi:hypothetical protein
MVQLILFSKSGNEEVSSGEMLKEGNRFECQNVLPGNYEAMMIVVKGMLNGGAAAGRADGAVNSVN